MDDVKIGEILEPGDEATQERQKERVQARFWKTLKSAARQVPFMRDVVAAYYCAMDPNTPMRVRGILLGALAYFVIPTDIVPDFIAFFGFTDDMAVLAAAISAIRGHITQAHYDAAEEALAEHDDLAGRRSS
ncbi:YkvA family protein [Pararhizobium mangrovi]|uniref:DUF1232 domain-containing protein n=1 Tax=Pararhizobium mangrovi TaxID=2590452 RepID=A0A506U506_9HYPH|nr:YkvA family protein [Pararhizobium mangrovi]TPW26997.1 DUF1232 domain-containing protein [Pararhizobium mangrovi]